MNDLLKELLISTRVVKRKYKDYLHLTPKEQHHLGMDAQIHIRFLKREVAKYAIKECTPIPIMFKTLGYIVVETTPIKIQNYLFQRVNRSKWATELNKTLELKYIYPNVGYQSSKLLLSLKDPHGTK